MTTMSVISSLIAITTFYVNPFLFPSLTVFAGNLFSLSPLTIATCRLLVIVTYYYGQHI